MLILLLLFLVVVIVFSIPSVQTSTAQYLTNSLNEDYDINLDVKRVQITYDGNVALKEVLSLDHRGDTLFFINRLESSILSLGNLLDGQPNLGSTSLDGVVFNLKRYKGEEDDNLQIFIEKLSDSTSTASSKFVLTTGDLEITNSDIKIIDENLRYPESFIATNFNATAASLTIDGSDIIVPIESSNFDMYNGAMTEINGTKYLKITDLIADLTYTPQNISVPNLSIKTENSTLKGDLQLTYDRKDFVDFVNKVNWDFRISEGDFDTNDLRRFYNEITPNERVTISGNLTGVLNDFKVDNLKVQTLDEIVIEGDMHFKNLIENEENFFIEGDFENLQVSKSSLEKFLPNILNGKMPKELNSLGIVKAKGYASVNANTVVSNLTGTTRKGNFDTQLTLTEIQSDQIGYNGNIILKSVNLGELLGVASLGKTTLNLDVNGRGFNPNNANSQLKGSISRFEFNGYTYRNIRVNGSLKKPLFNGELVVNDPNLKLTFDGLADFSDDINTYDFTANIEKADLNAINLFTRDSIAILQGNVAMKMKGTNLDDAAGTIEFKNTSYTNPNKKFFFEDFLITSYFKEEERFITINSTDIIEGELSGKFIIEEIPELFKNSIGNVYTNYKSESITQDQYLKYEFKIYDKIVDLVFPFLDFGENTILKGEVASNEAEFRMNFRTPEVQVYDMKLDDVNVQVNNQNPLFNTYIKVENFKNGIYDIDDFQLINVTRQDTLLFRTEFVGSDDNSEKFNLSFYHTVNSDNNSVIGVRKSDINFRGKEWLLNKKQENVQLVFDHDFKDFKLDTIVAQHKKEKVVVSGNMNGTQDKDLFLDFENVRLSSLLKPIDSLSMKGKLDGYLSVSQKDGNYAPVSDFTVTDLNVNETPLGDFALEVKGNDALTAYNVNAQLKNKNDKSFQAKGTIDTSGKYSTINVDTYFNDFNLIALSPLGGIVLDNMRGFASGEVAITGRLVEPDLDGELLLKNAGLRVPYLNTDFDFGEEEEITITTGSFDFNTVELTDTKYGTTGELTGEIRHKNFGFWELDLALASDRLLVLNTELTPDALYYGTAFINGDATIKGPAESLVIDVVATTGAGTVFKIPIDDGESLGDTSAIYFLSPEEKEARLNGEDVAINDVDGLELNFDLNITPEAEVEITVDPTNGSYLKGSGAGNLLLEINTNGKFIMNGDFIVTDGIYNFKYAGIVNKNFIIQPGGTIDWNGDPFNANIDVKATYYTNANPSILLDNPNLNAQIPVEVVTELQGDLTYFDPEFDIQFPSAGSVVSSELQYRLQDKAQRQLQALSLVATGSFYNPNSIGQNAVTGNVVESVTGIVNDLVNREDSKLQFGVNYEASERNPNSDLQRSDRFGITLSTQINDRVLINGKLGVPVGNTSSTERTVIGNVQIEFLLNDDGSLRLKLFNRENTLQQLGQQEDFTQGIGLQYSVDFDSLKELYNKIFKKQLALENKKKARREEEEETVVNFK